MYDSKPFKGYAFWKKDSCSALSLTSRHFILENSEENRNPIASHSQKYMFRQKGKYGNKAEWAAFVLSIKLFEEIYFSSVKTKLFGGSKKNK